MKTKILLSLFILMLTVIQLNAQSHNTKTPNCKYYQKSTSTNATAIEGGVIPVCTACKVLATKENEAKAAEDKRRAIAISEKKKADQIERQKTLEKEKKESEAKVKASEVFVTMPKTSSINNSISNEKTGQNSDSHNPETKSQLDTETPNTSGNNPLTNYTPTTNYTSTSKSEIYTAVATTVINSLADEMLANLEKKEAAREAKRHTETMAAIEKADLRFNTVYLPLMNLAEKGNENARMILYFTSEMYKREFLVPLREQWLEEAYYNKNFDAIIRKSLLVISEKDGYKNSIPLLEKAANMGSVDAMMMLASFYDLARSSVFSGGEDPKKALEWYNKAAENGSPNAMYLLGRIYKYGRTPDLSGSNGFVKKWHVKYDVVLDEKVAFDWFTKSLRPDYIESIYSRTIKISLRDFGLGLDASYFNKKSYLELANIYEKGKAIPKDKAKAIELMNLYGGYVNTQIIE